MMDGSSGPVLIVLALIGLASTIWSAYITTGRRRQRRITNDAKKGNDSGEHALIIMLQEELSDKEKRHQQDMIFVNDQLRELRLDLRKSYSREAVLMKEITKLNSQLQDHGVIIDGLSSGKTKRK